MPSIHSLFKSFLNILNSFLPTIILRTNLITYNYPFTILLSLNVDNDKCIPSLITKASCYGTSYQLRYN